MRFVLAMTWREIRSSAHRSFLLVASICFGVGALVAIHSFTANLDRSLVEGARSLLGADLLLYGAQPFSEGAEREVSALRTSEPGSEEAHLVRFAAMAYIPRTSGTRLVQVVAVQGHYPFYGSMVTAPAAAWSALSSGDGVVVDPALLEVLDGRVGDSLRLGSATFTVQGVVQDAPGDISFRSAMGPRVFVSAGHLKETGLLVFGSRARYETYLKLPSEATLNRIADRHRARLAEEHVTIRTVQDNEESLSKSFSRVGRYLGLVALIALLLGGLGVGSATSVLIERRIDTIAILRCLGAPGGALVFTYLLYAALLGLVGSAVGALSGLGVQLLLPRLVGDLLPVDVKFVVSWPSVLAGLGVGLLVAAAFALGPLLAVRRVSPLRVFQRSYETEPRQAADPLRLLSLGLIPLTVLALSVVEAGNVATGLFFTGGIFVALLTLWAAAFGLTWALRRALSPRIPYVVRQGLSNLYRPANQTRMVLLALGFGAFLLDTLLLVQHNLLRELRPAGGSSRANLALFDIQPDQRGGVAAKLQGAGTKLSLEVPIIPMRIVSLKGVAAPAILARPESSEERGPRAWAVRREYRSTRRDVLQPLERTVSGRFWRTGEGKALAPGAEIPISVEKDVARELSVGVGDEIVWDVQGLQLPSRVVHIRDVQWARFEPNFFVVFPEGPLDAAPQTYLDLSRVDDALERMRLVRAITVSYPNVTALDLSQVQQAVESIISRGALITRFMALLTLATGAIVLLGAVSTSRYQRTREAVLLKTLGATRRQILSISVVEYSSLGFLGALVAMALSLLAALALVHFVFDSAFAIPWAGLLVLTAFMSLLSLGVGVAGSLDLFARLPLELLRNE